MSISELRAIIPGRLYKVTPMYWKTTSGRTLYFFDTAACKRCVKTTRDEVSVIMALELHEGERFMLKCLVGERVAFFANRKEVTRRDVFYKVPVFEEWDMKAGKEK